MQFFIKIILLTNKINPFAKKQGQNPPLSFHNELIPLCCGGEDVQAKAPPSTAMQCPVMKLACSEHSHSATSATSLGWPMRFMR